MVLWRGEHFLKGDLQHYHKWQRSEDDRAPKEKGRSDSTGPRGPVRTAFRSQWEKDKDHSCLYLWVPGGEAPVGLSGPREISSLNAERKVWTAVSGRG